MEWNFKPFKITFLLYTILKNINYIIQFVSLTNNNKTQIIKFKSHSKNGSFSFKILTQKI